MLHTNAHSRKIIPTHNTTRIGFAPAYDFIDKMVKDIEKFCEEHEIPVRFFIRACGMNINSYYNGKARRHMDLNAVMAFYYVMGYDLKPIKKKEVPPIYTEKEFVDNMAEFSRIDRISQAKKRGTEVDENGNVIPKVKIRIKKPKQPTKKEYEKIFNERISRRTILETSKLNATNFLSVD